jgi:hypothetical protein
MANTRIVLDRQSDLMLTGATLSSPYITNPVGLVEADISGLTYSLSSLEEKDTSIDNRLNNFQSGLFQYVTFSGAVDNINKTFTNTTNDLSNILLSLIFVNGLLQEEGGDYSISLANNSSTITFVEALKNGSKLSILIFRSTSI